MRMSHPGQEIPLQALHHVLVAWLQGRAAVEVQGEQSLPQLRRLRVSAMQRWIGKMSKAALTGRLLVTEVEMLLLQGQGVCQHLACTQPYIHPFGLLMSTCLSSLKCHDLRRVHLLSSSASRKLFSSASFSLVDFSCASSAACGAGSCSSSGLQMTESAPGRYI